MSVHVTPEDLLVEVTMTARSIRRYQLVADTATAGLCLDVIPEGGGQQSSVLKRDLQHLFVPADDGDFYHKLFWVVRLDVLRKALCAGDELSIDLPETPPPMDRWPWASGRLPDEQWVLCDQRIPDAPRVFTRQVLTIMRFEQLIETPASWGE